MGESKKLHENPDFGLVWDINLMKRLIERQIDQVEFFVINNLKKTMVNVMESSWKKLIHFMNEGLKRV